MDINTYVERLTKSGVNLTQFSKKIGMSRMYLGHILKKRKKNISLETIMKLVAASDGEITLCSLRPDLFPKGKKGSKALEQLRKSAR